MEISSEDINKAKLRLKLAKEDFDSLKEEK